MNLSFGLIESSGVGLVVEGTCHFGFGLCVVENEFQC